MRELKDVTIICIDTKYYAQSLKAIKECLKHVTPSRCLFLTDVQFDAGQNIEVVKINKINSKKEYSEFVIKELWKYFDTSHCLVVQWDGYILNSDVWSNEFTQWDYIGAPWDYDSDRVVGNGGFSLRSRRLCKILGQDNFIDVLHPEDQSVCILYKYYLEEKYGIQFAPREVAKKFAYETIPPTNHTFGFHNFSHESFKDHVVIQREGAAGDVIMCEPILQHYYEQGYQVVLDTQPQFMDLFKYHHFRVKHISQMHPDIKPLKVIDLNMAYELKPKMPVLQAYAEKSGINIPLRNSQLNMPVDEKLFKKYAVIHCDSTGIPHRDLHNIDWDYVVKNLEYRGYTVFQIGKRTKEEVALHFNTMTIEMLMFFIKGADLFIGLDSGNAQISVALGVPSIILAGSVNLKYRYNDFSKIIPIQGKCEKEETQHCYHESISTTGQDCIYNKELPPCSVYSAGQIVDAINKFETCHIIARQTK